MTFGSTFGRVLSPTFQPSSQAVVASGGWWDLDGTITSCVAAYQAKGAASLAASYDNLTGNATYDLTVVGDGVSWNTTDGWLQGSSANCLSTGIAGSGIDDTWSWVVRYSNRGATGASWALGNGAWYVNGANHYYGLYSAYSNRRVSIGIVNSNHSARNSGIDGLAGAVVYEDGSAYTTLTGYDAYYLDTSQNLKIAAGDFYVQAVAIYNAVLTSTQMSDLYTAMAAL